jgi:hypothetical protein
LQLFDFIRGVAGGEMRAATQRALYAFVNLEEQVECKAAAREPSHSHAGSTHSLATHKGRRTRN